MTPTRKRLGILRERGLATLETNAYANEQPGGHGIGAKNFTLIKMFVSELPRLRAIIAHGREAHELLGNLNVPTSIKAWKQPHFSGLPARKGAMSDAIVKNLADEVKNWINGSAG